MVIKGNKYLIFENKVIIEKNNKQINKVEEK